MVAGRGDFGEGELKQMAAVHACVVEMAVQAAEMLTRETLPGQSAGPRSQGSSADGCALIVVGLSALCVCVCVC